MKDERNGDENWIEGQKEKSVEYFESVESVEDGEKRGGSGRK